MLENVSVEIYLPSYVKFETKCIFATFLRSTKQNVKIDKGWNIKIAPMYI